MLLAGVVGGLMVVTSLPRLVPPGTLRLARGLPSVIVVRGLFTAAFFGAETYVPLALHAERGIPLAQAGLALTGGALGWAAGSYLQARPGLRLHRATLLSTGGIVVAVAVAALSLVMLDAVSPWMVVPCGRSGGLGMGMALSSTSVLVLGLSAPGQQGSNSASLQVSDALGSVVGVGAAGAVFAAGHSAAGQDASAVRRDVARSGSRRRSWPPSSAAVSGQRPRRRARHVRRCPDPGPGRLAWDPS